MKESKFRNKLSSMKANMKRDNVVMRFIVGVVRWFATILITYAFTASAIVSAIPFTASYLAGIANLSKKTDLISGLVVWGFPTLAATLIITVLVIWVDVQIYKFFKKWLSVDGMKQNAETLEKKAAEFTDNSKVESISSRKNRKAK